ncbi:MAG: methyltransferase [Alphaproteobacteria bacterium]
MELTQDKFLGGKITLTQPRHGYRAAIDPVLLAAAVTAMPGQKVLDLGCGAGAAMLCLAARVPGLVITGVELQASFAELAAENAAYHSDIAMFHVKPGDARKLSRTIAANSFDHVMANPPFHDQKSHDPGPRATKNLAQAMSVDDLNAWVKSAHGRLKHRGVLTMIYRADGLPDLLAAMYGKFGGITVLPLWPKAGVPAKRILIRGMKDSKAPFSVLTGMTLHATDGAYHSEIKEIFSGACRGIAWT